ncbi:MAG TPA: organic hydroperoxide resistance protein [Myxococcota bacterium]|nr:organic hydroperoxide resistance protein [Myxococcota bacterium]
MSNPNVVLAKTLYTATATAIGGRDGKARSDDGKLEVAIAPPRELGGNGAGTNPEQLFAAGYAACFGSALSHVAKLQKIQTGPVSVTAKVAIGPAGAGFGLAVELVVDVPELDRTTAEALVATAHQVCPYSNATRGNIAVDLKLA